MCLVFFFLESKPNKQRFESYIHEEEGIVSLSSKRKWKYGIIDVKWEEKIFVRRILMHATLSATNLINHRSAPFTRNILLIVFNEHCETNVDGLLRWQTGTDVI